MGRSRKVQPARRRATAALLVGALALVLAGCSAERTEQLGRLGFPEGASAEGNILEGFWVGTWIAAFAVGILVWGLILFAAFRYRKKNEDIPPQTRFNLPIEVLYTVTPLFIIAVYFMFTVEKQNEVLSPETPADHSIEVIGQQWSWTFNYTDEGVSTVGTPAEHPTLVLPVDQTVEFVLNSPDVIHSFWVPAFYMKMDVFPGKPTNTIQVTPDREGTFAGKCAEFCGVYHQSMLFNVEVVSQEEYDAHIAELRADPDQQGIVEAPLRAAYSTKLLDQSEETK